MPSKKFSVVLIYNYAKTEQYRTSIHKMAKRKSCRKHIRTECHIPFGIKTLFLFCSVFYNSSFPKDSFKSN